MKILWLCAGIMPEACERLGLKPSVGGGWLQSMLNALRKISPESEVCVVCLDYRSCDIVVGKTRHITVPAAYTYSKVPDWIRCRIKQLIAEFSPDVIHIQGTEYFYGRMDQDVYCSKPVVVSLQGILSEYWVHFTGGIPIKAIRRDNLFNPRAILRGKTIFREQELWRDERAIQEQEVFRLQKNFIGRTEWDRHCLECYNPSARYFHVNENLRPSFYAVRRDRLQIRQHSIYCAGAAAYPLKGAHWLFMAVAMLKDEFPDIQLRIAGAQKIMSRPKGLGEWLHRQVYYDYLRRLSRKLGVDKHIVALPSLDAEAVAEELCNAELYVSASLCENSPNSLGEAMLVGTPVVHTCVGGVPSILKDGIEGKLVPAYDPHALAGAIRDRFRNPSLSESCVAAARATAIARHNVMQNAEATLAVYKELSKQ